VKQIFKTKEPLSLTTYRAGIPKKDLEKLEKFDTSPSDVKDELRNKLLKEQGFICCYCMDRVEFHNSKIEHFKPRSLFRGEQLDYSNLFIACLGGEGRTQVNQHCDTKKGNNRLNNINLTSNLETNIHYRKNGEIFSENKNIDKELNEILNLNYEDLKTNREDAFNQLIVQLNQSNWTIPILKSNLAKYQVKNSKNKYRPYCEMIVYFLTKKLRSKGAIK